MTLFKALDDAQSRHHKIVFVILLFFALGVRVLFFQGYDHSDPRHYSLLADELSRGVLHIPHMPEDTAPPVFYVRLGVYVPVAALIKLFGLSEIVLVAYPFAISLLSCVLAYLFARKLFSPLEGLIAFALFALLPYDVKIASILVPDAVAAFWANLALYLLWRAVDAASLKAGSVLAILGGLLFGLSWLCKEAVVYLVPFVIVLVLFGEGSFSLKWRLSLLVSLAIGSLFVLGGEFFLYSVKTGDALYRLHETERNYMVTSAYFFDSTSPFFGWEEGGYWKAVLKRILYTGPLQIFLSETFLYLPSLALLGVAWGAFVGVRRHVHSMVLIWLAILVFMFNFMTSSLDSYKPLILHSRYLYPILLPSVILFSGFLGYLLRGGDALRLDRERLFWGLLIGAGILLLCAKMFIHLDRTMLMERHVSRALKMEDVVYTDSGTAYNLLFFRENRLSGVSDLNRSWDTMNGSDFPVGAYVLVNMRKLKKNLELYKEEIPFFAQRPPGNWRKVQRVNEATLYKVETEN
jgi:4-amino-4-deoxy-L-arabinose transferase-like glycosyltransferase